MIFLEELLV